MSRRAPRLGLALGSGSARGWAHIGVIRALQQAGIKPDLVCGASIGAVVGAAYALGELDRFEHWARSTADAVRASMALPGLFTPAQRPALILFSVGKNPYR